MSLTTNWSLCPKHSILHARANVISNNDCQDAVVRPGLITDAPQEFPGTCFNFKIALTNRKAYSFKVYISGQVKDLEEYLNNYLILFYSDGITKQLFTKGMLDIIITDKFYKIFEGYEPMTYQFASDQIPLEWKSYGQFITLNVRIHDVFKIKHFLKIVVIANFQRDIALSYLTPRGSGKSCNYADGHYPTRNNCTSIHANFSGSWNMANDFCHQKGGYLWSVNSFEEWDEILRSPKVTYDMKQRGPTNVAKYFRTTSVLFLGFSSQVWL